VATIKIWFPLGKCHSDYFSQMSTSLGTIFLHNALSPLPNFCKWEPSNLASEFALGTWVWFWNKFYHGKRVPMSTRTLMKCRPWGPSGQLRAVFRAASESGFRVTIRCFIALAPVTSSTRMQSSVPPGKTNLHSRDSFRPIKAPYPYLQ
jgi:hypothetical protein